MRRLTTLAPEELMTEAKTLGAPYDLVRWVAKQGRLPVPNFSAGGIATPADAALMMRLGAEGIFVGSGVFKKPQKVAESVPNFEVAALVWVAVGLLALLGALSLAEVAVLFPRAGGNYVFLREGYGRMAGFLFGWVEFWIIRSASLAALATIFTESLHDVLRETIGAMSEARNIELSPIFARSGGVDLVVMPAVRKSHQFAEVVGEPMGGVGQVDEAVLDGGGLGVKAHNLVAAGLVARDLRDTLLEEFLDKLRPGGFVVNQDNRRRKHFILSANLAFEVGVPELFAENV